LNSNATTQEGGEKTICAGVGRGVLFSFGVERIQKPPKEETGGSKRGKLKRKPGRGTYQWLVPGENGRGSRYRKEQVWLRVKLNGVQHRTKRKKKVVGHQCHNRGKKKKT